VKFEWDLAKENANEAKHGISFSWAKAAFDDPRKRILTDEAHSRPGERRFFCIGKVGEAIVTVRFTVRSGKIRIFGAGLWREGKRRYEEREDG
jgi:uncharacterized protein